MARCTRKPSKECATREVFGDSLPWHSTHDEIYRGSRRAEPEALVRSYKAAVDDALRDRRGESSDQLPPESHPYREQHDAAGGKGDEAMHDVVISEMDQAVTKPGDDVHPGEIHVDPVGLSGHVERETGDVEKGRHLEQVDEIAVRQANLWRHVRRLAKGEVRRDHAPRARSLEARVRNHQQHC